MYAGVQYTLMIMRKWFSVWGATVYTYELYPPKLFSQKIVDGRSQFSFPLPPFLPSSLSLRSLLRSFEIVLIYQTTYSGRKITKNDRL